MRSATACTSATARRARVTLRLGLALALAGTLSACGVGAPDSGSDAPKASIGTPPAAPPTLAITTTALPAGQPGLTYPATALAAANAAGAVTWSLASGALPTGVSLSPSGVLSGTPQTTGFHSLTVRASTATQSATRTLGFSVGVFGVVASAGLVEAKAWTQVPVTLTCSGATGSVRFEVVATDSAGAFTAADAAGATATWTPGERGGPGLSDTLRAVDTVSGASAQVTFPVLTDPTAGHVAAFGRTDVWYLDPTVKVGAHPYASDFHAALVPVGLRQAASTSAEGAPCDRLAEMAVRLAMLRHLNLFYLRNADGSEGQGLLISFPYHAPAGHERPSAGSWLQGRSDRYSVMALAHGTRASVVGTAFQDGAANPVHENDTSAPGAGDLGVFANQFVDLFNMTYNNWELTERPITAADAATLEAVVYGQDVPAGRPAAIRMAIEGLGRSLAAVAAHEIGHSLGLPHTAPSQPGSLMNASGAIAPTAVYRFTDADVAALRARLPGTGRWGSASAKPGVASEALALTLPEGGLQVCEGTRCDLHVPTCTCGAHGHARR